MAPFLFSQCLIPQKLAPDPLHAPHAVSAHLRAVLAMSTSVVTSVDPIGAELAATIDLFLRETVTPSIPAPAPGSSSGPAAAPASAHDSAVAALRREIEALASSIAERELSYRTATSLATGGGFDAASAPEATAATATRHEFYPIESEVKTLYYHPNDVSVSSSFPYPRSSPPVATVSHPTTTAAAAAATAPIATVSAAPSMSAAVPCTPPRAGAETVEHRVVAPSHPADTLFFSDVSNQIADLRARLSHLALTQSSSPSASAPLSAATAAGGGIAPAQAAMLLHHLQELSRLHRDRSRRDAALLESLEAEWQRRAATLASAHARALAAERAHWIEYTTQLRAAAEADAARASAAAAAAAGDAAVAGVVASAEGRVAEVVAAAETAVAAAKAEGAQQVEKLNDEIASLKAQAVTQAQALAFAQAQVQALTQQAQTQAQALARAQEEAGDKDRERVREEPLWPDLRARVRELLGEVEAKTEENARLARALRAQRFIIKVKEPKARAAPYERHSANEGRSSVWSSGAVARAYLNKKNPFPAGTEVEVEGGDVTVLTEDGDEVDASKFVVKYIIG